MPVARWLKDFYRSKEWRDARAQVLQEQPTCAVKGCTLPSTHVDHIRSIENGGPRLARWNLQGLCHSHHSTKTAMLDGGFGNANGSGRVKVKGCDASGQPLDPDHFWNRRK